MKLVLIGIAIGAALAVGAAQLSTSMLLGTSPLDPVSFATPPLVLLLVARLAAWLPARRAARIDPMSTVRAE
jgi:ABC-type antimicrobial peptide transport system permease subunit